MTLKHVFIVCASFTLYLCAVFLYEMWRYRNGHYETPKASEPDDAQEKPAPMKQTPAAAEAPRRSPPVASQPTPSAERHNELLDWLTDHRKRDPSAAPFNATK